MKARSSTEETIPSFNILIEGSGQKVHVPQVYHERDISRSNITVEFYSASEQFPHVISPGKCLNQMTICFNVLLKKQHLSGKSIIH
mmetsp:Transcript_11643/g.18012  ORF Transcript_11643/g.18012 Transcript_11643/m.18012 type:complete len:86 (+) Transcript_11643:216-473(+)